MHYLACNVKWLGLRGHDLPVLPDQAFAPLKPKDLQIAQSLMSSGILQVSYPEPLNLAPTVLFASSSFVYCIFYYNLLNSFSVQDILTYVVL